MPSNLRVNGWKSARATLWLAKPEHAARLHPPGCACPNQYQVITSAACKKRNLVLSAHDTRPPSWTAILFRSGHLGEDVRCP
jgi:hypothetical protein